MKFWVYIYEDKKDDFKIGLSTINDNLTSINVQKLRFVYLRPFIVPFDAIAHKHLLDDISKESVLKLIDKYKVETRKWLKLLFESECKQTECST